MCINLISKGEVKLVKLCFLAPDIGIAEVEQVLSLSSSVGALLGIKST